MLILSNVETLYDGSSADESALHRGVDLFLADGRVKGIAPHAPDAPLAPEDTRVDCTGLTVTPGLIDCHGHVYLIQ